MLKIICFLHLSHRTHSSTFHSSKEKKSYCPLTDIIVRTNFSIVFSKILQRTTSHSWYESFQVDLIQVGLRCLFRPATQNYFLLVMCIQDEKLYKCTQDGCDWHFFLIQMNAPGTIKSTLDLSPLSAQLVAAAFPTLTIWYYT